MHHPSEGALRRLLDEPAAIPDTNHRHVAECARCAGDLAEMRDDAAVVGASLSVDRHQEVDLEAAWQRLWTVAPAQEGRRTSVVHRPGRTRELLRRPLVAGVAAAVLVAGASTAAATDWLEIFKTEQVAPVRLSASDLNALPDLRAYGAVDVTGEGGVHQVANAAAAEAESGLDVPKVAALPAGVSGEPVYQVGGQVSATFTFSADRAAAAAAEAGKSLPPPPEGVDGSRVRLVAGPGVAQVWQSSTGAPALLVGRAVAPSASSSGVPFEIVRNYILSLPGLPKDAAAQLRTFADDGSLPLPVPAAEVDTSPATVNGERATVLTAKDGTIVAVVWVNEGMLTAVAGSLDKDEVLSVANGLR